jgi:hypothetical protein
MRLTKKKREELLDMIDSQTFYGVPLGDISVDIIDEVDEQDVRDLYIVAYMLGCEVKDRESFDHFPYEANEYLKKFRV